MNNRQWPYLLPVNLLFLNSDTYSSAEAQDPPVPSVKVLIQSPAETTTDLQIICMFRPGNPFHGSLVEINRKLSGLIERVHKPDLFGGELGETLLLIPPPGTLTAKRLLMIGLGDPATFTPDRLYLVGKIAFCESNRLGIAHPFFAPTLLDGGVAGFKTREVAAQVVRGFRDAFAAEAIAARANAAPAPAVIDIKLLVGPQHAVDAQSGIDSVLIKVKAAP